MKVSGKNDEKDLAGGKGDISFSKQKFPGM
jgi:hypothetical protein